MGEHTKLMADMRLTREQYLGALRKQQPLSELRRKADKSARLKGRIWTQEQTDLIAAEAVDLLVRMVACNEAI